MKARKDTRQRLIDSACYLFYTRSYANVGVKEICDKAGVQKGSFYHFFPSKEKLTLAVLEEHFADFKDKIITKSFDPKLPPMQRIKRLMENAYLFQVKVKEETGQTLGCPYGNISAEMSTQNEVIQKVTDSFFAKIEVGFEEILKEAVQNGDIEPIDTKKTAIAMLSYIEGMMLLARNRNNPEIIKQLSPAILEIRIKPDADFNT